MNLLKLLTNFRLRTKFMVPISALLIASIITVSGYLINRQAESFRRELESSGETMVRILAMQAESGVIFESKYELDELLSQLMSFDDVEYAEIRSKDSRLLAYMGLWSDSTSQRLNRVFNEEFSSAGCEDFYVKDAENNEYIEFSYPIITKIEVVDREKLGITSGLDDKMAPNYRTETIGRIRLILSLEKVQHSIADARTAAILLTIIVMIVTVLILTWFVRYITKPVQALVDVTDRVSHGELDQQVEIQQDDEIGHLAKTFNQMVVSLRQSRDEIEEYNRNLEAKIVDRTEALENAQSQLIQSEKMSAIGQLAAGVAHELNNPLGGILGYAQFALEKMKKQIDRDGSSKELEGYIRYLTDIESQSRRCKGIVQNLLRFSRSSRTSDFDDIDINEVLDETRTFVEHQLHMNQIELEMTLDHNLPIVFGNAGQLQQVFTNMIINAMHASPADSTIRIVTRSSPALGEFGGAIEVIFSDQGCGISPANLKKIFEPFFTTKEVGKGTGLGLSVSYGIVKDHGGEIKVETEEGHGTTFTIVLPIQKIPQSSDTQEKEYLRTFESNRPS